MIFNERLAIEKTIIAFNARKKMLTASHVFEVCTPFEPTYCDVPYK
jgi:hypothetical protein